MLLGDRFEVRNFLGGSGRTQVYSAFDQFEEAPVAVKLVHLDGASDQDLRRLEADTRRMRDLRHPLLVDTLAFGDFDDRMFLAMEQMTGDTLRDALDARLGQPLPIGDAVVLARQMALALAAAHKVGVLHRDVKPSQVFLTDFGRGVKLGDFGLSRFATDSAEVSLTHATAGSTAYVAPERVESGECSEQTDLWSLGVALYEMVSGVRPFTGKTLPHLLYAVTTADVIPPRVHNQLVPEALDALICQLLAKDPADRVASAEDVAERITQATGRRG